jgi:Asp-tRNA(Asn)/Glu-tRNA(Gln) amidotransferase A subunit family amidase
VKEIVETKGLATEYGSAIYRGRIATTDAAIVTLLRRTGAQIFGTTRSTAFAYFTPTVTRNPHNPENTPGGSSSGSAAAVAAGMVPVAVGTQTAGSVLRPASFCGVTGFKPGFGVLPTEGIYPFAPSLDTAGFFTATAADMAALWLALGWPVAAPEDITFGVVEPLPAVEPVMAAAFGATIERCRRAGFRVEPVDLRAMQATLEGAVRTVMQYEAARIHERHFREQRALLGPLGDLVAIGLAMPEEQYAAARRDIADWKERMAAQFQRTPVILTPASLGPAPRGLSATGDPRMHAPWTALGTPAIAVPMPVGDGLPMGLQMTAAIGDEARLLRAAMTVEAAK